MINTWHCLPGDLDRRCSGRHGYCSRTGRKHICLQGTDPKSRRLWTSIAEPYPAAMAAKAADLLIQTSEGFKQQRLNQILLQRAMS